MKKSGGGRIEIPINSDLELWFVSNKFREHDWFLISYFVLSNSPNLVSQ